MNEWPTARRTAFSSETFESFDCTAKPHPVSLSWGLCVRIDIRKSDERVGCVLACCAFDHAAFDALSSLAPSELCDLALSRFVAGDLSVTLKHVLSWQEEIAKLGYDCVSPLAASIAAPNA
jgi:hypothetical protein